jgi:hypothetical protein
MIAILALENSGMVLRIPITAPAAASISANDGVDIVARESKMFVSSNNCTEGDCYFVLLRSWVTPSFIFIIQDE